MGLWLTTFTLIAYKWYMCGCSSNRKRPIRVLRIAQICFLVMTSMSLCCGAVTADESFPASGAAEFARVVHDENGRPLALQVAISRYASTGREPALTVDLVAAVHVGDKGYYAELNQRFQAYDAVLFELIAPEGSQDRIADSDRKGVVSGAQLLLTRALGLSFQLDEIDYGRPNFVHADLSPDELSASMQERGESLYVYFWRMFYASVRESSKDPLGIRTWRNISGTTGEGESTENRISLRDDERKRRWRCIGRK